MTTKVKGSGCYIEWKTEASTRRDRREHALGVIEWDGLPLDRWEPHKGWPCRRSPTRCCTTSAGGGTLPPKVRTGPIVHRVLNADGMGHHLKAIAAQVAPGAHAVLICDGAGWHQTGGRLRVPGNITLLPLPPYSPELNPMENVWHYLRENILCSRVWDTYDDIVEACSIAWRFLTDDPQRIRSIGHRKWACVSL